jgi:hypothetical protein
MHRALERHNTGKAVVVPVILRPAAWETTPFGHLKALPKDGLAITSWRDKDLALVDVARGIQSVVEQVHAKKFKRIRQK